MRNFSGNLHLKQCSTEGFGAEGIYELPKDIFKIDILTSASPHPASTKGQEAEAVAIHILKTLFLM